jgi:SIR2-like domain
MAKTLKKNTITIILGAGAAIKIGGPSTGEITSKIRSEIVEWIPLKGRRIHKSRLLNEVGERLDHLFAPQACNFEHIFHTLEMLDSIRISKHPKVKAIFKQPLAGFVRPAVKFKWPEGSLLAACLESINKNLFELINEYESNINTPSNVWYSKFWNQISKEFLINIGTLNYDSTIENMITLEDGFEQINKFASRFNPTKLSKSRKSKIFHLHGNIQYGFENPLELNKRILEDSIKDLIKYINASDAKKSWVFSSQSASQSGDGLNVGPMITGLRKTDKLLSYPYSAYYNSIYNSIESNPNLLIIGYSFGDFHLNQMIQKFARIHKEKRRVVIVGFHPNPANWNPDPNIDKWLPGPMYEAIQRLFKMQNPFENIDFKSPITSKDGKAKLYLQGFKRVAEKHLPEIVDYFKSAR